MFLLHTHLGPCLQNTGGGPGRGGMEGARQGRRVGATGGTPRAEAQSLRTLGKSLRPHSPSEVSHTFVLRSPHPPAVPPPKAGITCLSAKTPRLVRHSQQQGQDLKLLTHKSIPTRVHQVPRSHRQSPHLERFLRENGFTRTHPPLSKCKAEPR